MSVITDDYVTKTSLVLGCGLGGPAGVESVGVFSMLKRM